MITIGDSEKGMRNDFEKAVERQRGFNVCDKTWAAMKRRMRIVKDYEFVNSYDEAVQAIAEYLNGHLRFRADLQEQYPELMVLAWHYAHVEYGCPISEDEYETFVEALRVDVCQQLMKRIKGFVGVREWYGK